MKGGIILIVVALLVGYLGVTGRYKCFSLFFSCIAAPDGATDDVTVIAPRDPGGPPTVYDPKTRQPLPFLPPIEALPIY